METTAAEPSELYELAEDVLRLQFRIMRLGLKVLPRTTRQHAVAAMSEAYEAAQITRQHFGEVIRAGLSDLERDAASEPPGPRTHTNAGE